MTLAKVSPVVLWVETNAKKIIFCNKTAAFITYTDSYLLTATDMSTLVCQHKKCGLLIDLMIPERTWFPQRAINSFWMRWLVYLAFLGQERRCCCRSLSDMARYANKALKLLLSSVFPRRSMFCLPQVMIRLIIACNIAVLRWIKSKCALEINWQMPFCSWLQTRRKSILFWWASLCSGVLKPGVWRCSSLSVDQLWGRFHENQTECKTDKHCIELWDIVQGQKNQQIHFFSPSHIGATQDLSGANLDFNSFNLRLLRVDALHLNFWLTNIWYVCTQNWVYLCVRKHVQSIYCARTSFCRWRAISTIIWLTVTWILKANWCCNEILKIQTMTTPMLWISVRYRIIYKFTTIITRAAHLKALLYQDPLSQERWNCPVQPEKVAWKNLNRAMVTHVDIERIARTWVFRRHVSKLIKICSDKKVRTCALCVYAVGALVIP